LSAGRELDTWIGPCKVRAIPWIDGEHIYVNVQCFSPGQSIERPPVWDKSVLVTDDTAGRELVFQFTHTLINYIEQINVSHGQMAHITVESPPKLIMN